MIRIAAFGALSYTLPTLLVSCGAPWPGLESLPPLRAWFCSAGTSETRVLPVRGVNLVAFRADEFVGSGAKIDDALRTFGGLGGNWVAVNFWWFQDRADSAEIAPDEGLYTISDEAIETAVRSAHTQGLNVLLRPMVDVRDATWRGEIRPSPAWFASYQAFLERYSGLATTWNVEAFSVGVELKASESHGPEWRALIAETRRSYDGQIVYCANFDSAAELAWWDAVDVIGIDAYYAVAPWSGADVRLMTCAWRYWLDQMEQTIGARFSDKPVWLTEVGARSARGAARLPWCSADVCFHLVQTQIVDVAEQANYYRATLLAVSERTWIDGVFWWCWYADPSAAYVRETDYTPQNKPAEDVLAEFWTPRP